MADTMIKKIDMNGAYVDWISLDNGVAMYTAHVRGCVGPVGFVWGIPFGECKQARMNRFEVLGSYVVPYARRNGVRSMLNDKLLEHYHTITTQSGSAEGGEQFMIASGYTLDKVKGLWAKTRKSSTTTTSSARTQGRRMKK